MRDGGRSIALAIACLLSACDDGGPNDALATARAAMAPYESRFASFESWVRRAYSVADPTSSERSLGETLFAPLRNDGGVLAVWIQAGPRAPRTLALPSATELPDMSDWTTVRDSALGWLRVARFDPCPVETPRGWRKEREPGCVIMSRDFRGEANPEPRITMAFIVRPDSEARAGTAEGSR